MPSSTRTTTTTTISSLTLRHVTGGGGGGGAYQKLARLGLLAVANLPKLVRSHPTAHFSHFDVSIEEAGDGEGEHGFWVYFSVAVSLVLLGGVFAGLTLG
jgi:hypothetical protein